MPGKWKLGEYAKQAYYKLSDVEGGKKANLTEILRDRISKILEVLKYKASFNCELGCESRCYFVIVTVHTIENSKIMWLRACSWLCI